MADNPLEMLSLKVLTKMQKEIGRDMPIDVEWQKALNGSCTRHMTCGA